MSKLSSLLKMAKFHAKDAWEKVKKDPERALLGGLDPVGGEIWGSALGKDYAPAVSLYGGPTGEQFNAAEASGIDVGPAKAIDKVGKVVGTFYGGQGLAGLGGKLLATPMTATTTSASGGTGIGAGVSPALGTPAGVTSTSSAGSSLGGLGKSAAAPSSMMNQFQQLPGQQQQPEAPQAPVSRPRVNPYEMALEVEAARKARQQRLQAEAMRLSEQGRRSIVG